MQIYKPNNDATTSERKVVTILENLTRKQLQNSPPEPGRTLLGVKSEQDGERLIADETNPQRRKKKRSRDSEDNRLDVEQTWFSCLFDKIMRFMLLFINRASGLTDSADSNERRLLIGHSNKQIPIMTGGILLADSTRAIVVRLGGRVLFWWRNCAWWNCLWETREMNSTATMFVSKLGE